MSNQRNSVRIIGGKWRGRKLSFPSFPDLRPTGDRARETLFNWLAGRTEGSRCLDLFAGSGCLGFEALSRGATHVTFVDVRSRVIEQLRQTALTLCGPAVSMLRAPEVRTAVRTAAPTAAPSAEESAGRAADLPEALIVRADARAWLNRPTTAAGYDLVFLDPPFDADLLPALLPLLVPHLRTDSQVYIERRNTRSGLNLPGGWTLMRETRTGAVSMSLVRLSADQPPGGGTDAA